MNQKSAVTCLSLLLAGVPLCAQAQNPAVGRWNLGEQDPGAVAGHPANATTTDAVGTNDLASVGAPYYSGNVPAGGSTLSISLDGASCLQGSILGNDGFDALYTNLDFNNFSLSCDVNVTAAGAAGFSFPVSMGDDRIGGVAIVEIGGRWELIHMNVAETSGGPLITTNTWTHLDLVRKNFGSGVETRLFINGVDSGLSLGSTPNIPQDFFTIGANELSSDVPGNVEGYFNGLVDNVVISNLDIAMPPTIGSLTVSPGTIYSGNSIILTANNVSGDTGSRRFAWRFNGAVVTNTSASSVTFTNVSSGNAGNYDVIVSNTFGSVTSAVVTVTVESPSLSAGADVARYRLGEDDPGAAAGNPGDATTKDAVGTAGLSAFGGPLYSANAAPGGSTLSMSFDGASWYLGDTNAIAALYAKVDFNNFSLSCDVYPTAFGGAGFSFPLAMGMNGPGGFAIVEIGGEWHVLQQGISQSAGVPATLNQWTHLELQRRRFGGVVQSRLFVDGVDVNASATAGPALPIAPILTVGGNITSDGATPEGLFSGQIDNVVLHDYSAGEPPSLAGMTVSPLNLVESGESFTLIATGTGGQLPLTYIWRFNGTPVTNTSIPSITFNNATAGQAGNYDLVITNAGGAITSAVVSVTVLAPGVSVGTTVAQYRLGEDDAGAAAAAPGAAQTQDAIGTNALSASGSPLYSATVPPGGSTLSMSFDGASDYQGSGPGFSALYSGIDFNNCSLSLDVYMTAAGSGGFSFPASVGGTGAAGGGFAPVEVGGNWEIINHTVQLSSGGPVIPLNTWQHLEVIRRNFGAGVETRLYIDGADTGLRLETAPIPPPAFLTVGGSETPNNAAGVEGPFSGLVDNVVLKSFNLVPPALTLQMAGGQAHVMCVGRPRANVTLWRTRSLSPAAWTSVASGVSDATGHAVLTDTSAPAGGAFYRATMP